jgi:hypothetical protein
VPVPYFLLFLCFIKVTQEIFSELDETKAEHPEIYRSFQKSEEETERGHGPTTQQGDVLAGAGAKLTREVFFNLWKYSSLVPRQRRQKNS